MKKYIVCLFLAALLLGGCETIPLESGPVTPSTGAGTQVPYYPTETETMVLPQVKRTAEGVCVTIPERLLGTNADTLTAEQIENGFIGAVPNEDGSVTYTIASDRYDAFITSYRKHAYDMVMSIENASDYASILSAECTADLSAITLQVIREEYQYSSDGMMVFDVGLTAITVQAYDDTAPGRCVITVIDENGEQLSQSVFPDDMA